MSQHSLHRDLAATLAEAQRQAYGQSQGALQRLRASGWEG